MTKRVLISFAAATAALGLSACDQGTSAPAAKTAAAPTVPCYDDKTPRNLEHVDSNDSRTTTAERAHDGRITAKREVYGKISHDFGQGARLYPSRTTTSVTFGRDGQVQTLTRGVEVQSAIGQWKVLPDTLMHGAPDAVLRSHIAQDAKMGGYGKIRNGAYYYTNTEGIAPIERDLACKLPAQTISIRR